MLLYQLFLTFLLIIVIGILVYYCTTSVYQDRAENKISKYSQNHYYIRIGFKFYKLSVVLKTYEVRAFGSTSKRHFGDDRRIYSYTATLTNATRDHLYNLTVRMPENLTKQYTLRRFWQ